jgi:cobalamin biosynthesis Mg chelatase CobN
MNPLQTGTPASEITPQNYKNSSQTGTVQGTLNSSQVQSTNNQLLKTETTSELKVVTGAQSQLVLGTTSDAVTVPQNQGKTGGSVTFLVVFLLVVSAAATIYFFRNFKISFNSEDE